MTTLRRCDGCKNSVENEKVPEGWRVLVMYKPPPSNGYAKMLHFCVACQKGGKVHDGYGKPVGVERSRSYYSDPDKAGRSD
jgi:hypothetical protein